MDLDTGFSFDLDVTHPKDPGPAPADTSYDLSPNVAGGPQKVRWNHLELIDFMLANPLARQSEIAAKFNYSQGWLSRIVNSDAFRLKFTQRRKEVGGPDLVMAMQETEERIRALSNEALSRLQERLAGMDNDQLLKTATFAAGAQGFGPKGAAGAQVNVQASFVVALPSKAASAEEWLSQHARRPPIDVDEVGRLPEAASSHSSHSSHSGDAGRDGRDESK